MIYKFSAGGLYCRWNRWSKHHIQDYAVKTLTRSSNSYTRSKAECKYLNFFLSFFFFPNSNTKCFLKAFVFHVQEQLMLKHWNIMIFFIICSFEKYNLSVIRSGSILVSVSSKSNVRTETDFFFCCCSRTNTLVL